VYKVFVPSEARTKAEPLNRELADKNIRQHLEIVFLSSPPSPKKKTKKIDKKGKGFTVLRKTSF
jgi:tryptophan synthase alpha subunit